MHDEDCAVGLLVQNVKGEEWTCYGDKRALNVGDENKSRCIAAIQASADEIYSAWVNRTTPSEDSYQAWTHAPTLDSAAGSQILCPLFKPGQYRRADVRDRRKREFTKDWRYITTAAECARSGKWALPITLDSPQGILAGTSVASTALRPWACSVYFQRMDGYVQQSVNNQGWTSKGDGLFTAKLFSPLAAISWDDGKEVSRLGQEPPWLLLRRTCCK